MASFCFNAAHEIPISNGLYFSGNEEEHIQYCFDIYDLNGDGMISREEMLNMLKTSLGRQGQQPNYFPNYL